MTEADRINELGQPIGFQIGNWQPPGRPARRPITGHFCSLEPLSAAAHSQQLFDANSKDRTGRLWTYMPYGPFEREDEYRTWVQAQALKEDPVFFAIVDHRARQATGVASFLRIHPQDGSIEVGHINFSPLLQKTAAATEAMYLMMAYVFDDLGYRRYEWKCDALNASSRRAAERLGFLYEGVFRQATVYKGRNRDTAWYAITDRDWTALKPRFEAWLRPDNFTSDGTQRTPLQARRSPV